MAEKAGLGPNAEKQNYDSSFDSAQQILCNCQDIKIFTTSCSAVSGQQLQISRTLRGLPTGSDEKRNASQEDAKNYSSASVLWGRAQDTRLNFVAAEKGGCVHNISQAKLLFFPPATQLSATCYIHKTVCPWNRRKSFWLPAPSRTNTLRNCCTIICQNHG